VIFELWCTITIGLLSLTLTVLSSKGQLFDNRKKWYKKVSKRGAVVIFLGLLIVTLSAIQYWMIDKRNAEKDELITDLQRGTPILIVKEDGVSMERKNGNLEFSISILSKDAPCIVYKIESRIGLYFEDRLIQVTDKYNLLSEQINIPRDQPLTGHQIVNSNEEIDFVYIGLVGDFSSLDRKKDFSVGDIYIYNIKLRETRFLIGEEKRKFLELLEL
jgi:hypothetical protein